MQYYFDNFKQTLTAIRCPVLLCLILTTWPHVPWPSSPNVSRSSICVATFCRMDKFEYGSNTEKPWRANPVKRDVSSLVTPGYGF